MTRFSLIVATMGRVAELCDLFDSIEAQRWEALDIILVDQNPDDRLAPIAAEYAARLPLRHIRTPRPHANAARNLGLRAAIGDVVAFPDDDCTLPAGTLAKVSAAFREPALQVLSGPAASPTGGLGSGRWHDAAGPITMATVWTSVIEFNLWLRRDTALALGGFDEQLGLYRLAKKGSASTASSAALRATTWCAARWLPGTPRATTPRCLWCIRISG